MSCIVLQGSQNYQQLKHQARCLRPPLYYLAFPTDRSLFQVCRASHPQMTYHCSNRFLCHLLANRALKQENQAHRRILYHWLDGHSLVSKTWSQFYI